ncbi:Males-absent on the first protein [Colletotrichum trifolii]|uniref:histone acetyltransferase n=1 Tax=Colletotrichum trifolii TaxID=5466 RepID=A0A4R8QXS5_COLTR|nr:Males-absent on the first protein [Colletotrichum trifolii]
MASVKGAQPPDDAEPDPPPPPPSPTTAGSPDSTRRATRQTPIPPPPIPPFANVSQSKPQPPFVALTPERKGRLPLKKISETPIPIPVLPTPSTSQSHHPPLGKHPASSTPTPPRSNRRKSNSGTNSAAMGAARDAKENVRPVTLVAPKINYQAAQPPSHRTGGNLVRPSPPTCQPPITSHFRPAPRPISYQNTPVPIPVPPTPVPKSTPAPPRQPKQPRAPSTTPKPTSTSTPVQAKPQAATSGPKVADKPALRQDRNVDKVMLGNICFNAWYPSFYGKEALGDASAGAKGGSGSAKNPTAGDPANAGAKNAQRKGADTPMLGRLYVCPVCFKYSKELVMWHSHVRMCESTRTVPGRKIYSHPRGTRTVRKELPRPAGKKAGVAVKYTEEQVTDEGEWSVWEVDGEQEGLFCQNLCLFAKLFLDNKSVCYDVQGFNYFLLVYTRPPKPDAPPNHNRPNIVGFFSKEKMSWDNNNLACILVFPPWQRKGLGALLMGVSYEISRREGVIGGPEKPISELGRKGYKRYWGGEIARWLLGCPSTNGDPTLLVDVEDCSKATWIALDDCLVTLREMGLIAEAGTGPGKPLLTKKVVEGEEDEEGDVEMADDEPEARPDVKRVKIDKAAVEAWVQANGISLEKVCDPNGFVEGYAIKAKEVEEEDE